MRLQGDTFGVDCTYSSSHYDISSEVLECYKVCVQRHLVDKVSSV